MTQRYIDPNSGAAPQPGGYGGSAAPVQAEGDFDVAVADEVTEAQEADEKAEKEADSAAHKAPARKPAPKSHGPHGK